MVSLMKKRMIRPLAILLALFLWDTATVSLSERKQTVVACAELVHVVDASPWDDHTFIQTTKEASWRSHRPILGSVRT